KTSDKSQLVMIPFFKDHENVQFFLDFLRNDQEVIEIELCELRNEDLIPVQTVSSFRWPKIKWATK
ncbi:MAG TPA: hypothetical protein VHL11_00525, partial [Phototrophicaceae bacterium]|nr:hypothetical protein [Phototrophicaceae bacterium]